MWRGALRVGWRGGDGETVGAGRLGQPLTITAVIGARRPGRHRLVVRRSLAVSTIHYHSQMLCPAGHCYQSPSVALSLQGALPSFQDAYFL